MMKKKLMGKKWKLEETLSVRTGARIMGAPRTYSLSFCEWFGINHLLGRFFQIFFFALEHK